MPFVYTVLVGIVAVTDRVKVTTGVTCPTVRYHPGIVTQMAETSTTLMEGRFALGIGSGENLNEHIFGDRLPPAAVRIERMREAIDLIRKLWMGEVIDHYGTHYIVEEARTFLLPETLPPIIASVTGAIAAKVEGIACAWWAISATRASSTGNCRAESTTSRFSRWSPP